MAHRNLLREVFGLTCMAVIVKKTNIALPPIARNIYIDEITDEVQNSTIPPLMALPEFMTATEATGFLPFILTLLVPLLGFFGNQIIEWAAEFLFFNGLLPLLRIIKRHFLAMIACANRCLLEMRARMGAFDDTVLDNMSQHTNQIDEKSRSGQPQATPATSNVNGLLPLLSKRHFRAMTAYVNRCLLEKRARMGSFDDIVLDNTRQHTNQIDEKSRSGEPQATPATSNGNEDGAHDSSMDVPKPAAISPETEQKLAVLETLLEESAQKDAQIQTLSKEVETQAQTIANLDQRNNSFETELRTALDPTGLHPPSKDVVAIASDLAEDFRRVSTEGEREKELEKELDRSKSNQLAEKENEIAEKENEISRLKELEKERERSESNQLAEKDNEITRLSEESTKLSSQITRLEDEQRSSASTTANTERQAKATEKRLRERVKAAEHTAANSYDERTYTTLRSQFDVVVGELDSAKNEKQDAIDAQGRLTTELEAERAKVAQLHAATHEGAAASQHSESVVRTKTAEIQLANERVLGLEREVQDKCRELEDKGKELADKVKELEEKGKELEEKGKELEEKGKELEGVEARARNAEEQSANNETKIGELQRNLQATQDQAKDANESNTLLKQELQKAEKELEEKDCAENPEAAESVSTNDLAAKIESLHSQLQEANKKVDDAFQDGFALGVTEGITSDGNLQPHRQQEDASVQTVEPGEGPLYEQVRQETLVSCEAKAAVLINEAVQQERWQGQERLEAAVAQREQAVKNSADEAWNKREADLTDLVNTQVGSAVSDRQTSLQAELLITQQRANNAEAKANVETQRAQAAELEIQKYQKGKASQDERIKGYTTEITALKQLVPTPLQRAESDCSVNDRLRAQAILEETVHRTNNDLSSEVLQQLSGVNQQIDELRLILMTQDEAPTREQLLGILQDAYIDNDMVNNLWIPDRQVLFQQCTGAVMRLAELRGVISRNQVPNKEAILTVLYKDRGDENAEWNGPDGEFFANEDENVNKTQNPGLREKLLPKTRKLKPAVTAQAQDPQLPNEPRGNQNLKRKDNPLDLRGDGSVFSQYQQQGPSSQEAAGERRETMPGFQLDPAQEDRLRRILAQQQLQRQQQQQQVQAQDNNNPQPFSVPPSSSFNFNFAVPPVPSSPEHPPRSEEGQTPIFSFNAPVDKAPVVNASNNPNLVNAKGHRIFGGLALLGAAMADKQSRTTDKKKDDDEEVLNFESAAASSQEGEDSEEEE